jgi:ATP-dependent RNA helicase DDX19/DBP5
MKRFADFGCLMQRLKEQGYDSLKLAGDMEPEARDRVAMQFKHVEAKVLIATDVIARGFDVSTVTLVINYDLPVDFESRKPAYSTYLHRIGRSGRFGRKGAAFNFIDTEKYLKPGDLPDSEIMDSISRYFNKDIPSVPADDEDAFIQALEDAGLATKED